MTQDDEATLRIEARFKNARLFNAIYENAVPALSSFVNGAAAQVKGPIKPWCDFHGISHQYVYELLNLKKGPLLSGWRCRIRPICQRLSDLLERDVEWLFPADLYKIKWPSVAVDVPHGRMLQLSSVPSRSLELPPRQEEDAIHRELRGAISGVLETLTPREERVIRARFGIGDDEHSLSEVACDLGVSRERTRQIEARALRKLRHQSRTKKLWPHIGPITIEREKPSSVSVSNVLETYDEEVSRVLAEGEALLVLLNGSRDV